MTLFIPANPQATPLRERLNARTSIAVASLIIIFAHNLSKWSEKRRQRAQEAHERQLRRDRRAQLVALIACATAEHRPTSLYRSELAMLTKADLREGRA